MRGFFSVHLCVTDNSAHRIGTSSAAGVGEGIALPIHADDMGTHGH